MKMRHKNMQGGNETAGMPRISMRGGVVGAYTKAVIKWQWKNFWIRYLKKLVSVAS